MLYGSFDENNITGSTMADLSGNSNVGACVMDSNCDTIPGLLINSSDFDGTNDYIVFSDVSGDLAHSPSKTLTISVWFKSPSFPASKWILGSGSATTNQ